MYIKGGEGQVKRVNFKNQSYLHPSIQLVLFYHLLNSLNLKLIAKSVNIWYRLEMD